MDQQELIAAQYKVLGHDGLGWTEIRSIPVNYRKFYKGVPTFPHEISMDVENGVSHDWYIGINPRKEHGGGKNEDVAYLTCIVIDIDPVRPKDTASTEEQHEGSLRLGRKIVLDLPSSILVDSGSGCHVYLPIEPIAAQDHNALSAMVGRFYENLRAKYGSKDYKIDSIQDLARVIRVWGSENHKSHRTCTPIGIEGIKEFSRYKLDLTYVSSTPNIEPIKSTEEERFEQLCRVHPGINKMMKGEGDFPSRSEADYAFILYLANAAFSLEDIKTLAKRNPLGRGPSLRSEDVERIVNKKSQDRDSISRSLVHGTARYATGLENRKPGFKTGFPKLDQMLAGLQKGKLYVIAARTNEGKTSFATQIAYNLVTQAIPVLYFPTELGYEPLFDKIVAQVTGIGLRQFQSGNFKEDEKIKIKESLEALKKLPFLVHEDFGLTVETVRQKAREICPGVIIIDYLQAFKFNASETGKQAGEIANIMRGLKQLNEELNVPILVCCQLNRGAINNELNLSQLKGSGSIEEFSDVVIGLSTLSKFEYPRPVDLYVLKSRYSEVGKVRLDFFSTIGQFKEHE